MKQGIDHCGEEEMAPLSPTDRGNQRRRRRRQKMKIHLICGENIQSISFDLQLAKTFGIPLPPWFKVTNK